MILNSIYSYICQLDSLWWLAQIFKVRSLLIRRRIVPLSLCFSSLTSPVPLSFHSGGSFSEAKRYSLARLGKQWYNSLTGCTTKYWLNKTSPMLMYFKSQHLCQITCGWWTKATIKATYILKSSSSSSSNVFTSCSGRDTMGSKWGSWLESSALSAVVSCSSWS